MKTLIKTMNIKHRHPQAGFGLIEVLMAMLVLGVGVLGFAALQVRASQATGESYFRSQAMAIAQDVVERYQVNRGASALYLTQAKWNITTPVAADAVLTQCNNVACNTLKMVEYDIAQSLYTANTQLPSGLVRMQACNGSLATCVYVAWGGTTATSGAATTDCVTALGVYVPGANCIMMEAN